MKKSFYPALCVVVLFTLLSGGCGKGGSRYVNSSENERAERDASGAAEDFPLKKYQEKFLNNRTEFPEVKRNYQKEAEEVRQEKEERISFEDAMFAEFPDTAGVSVLRTISEDIRAEESIRVIKQWLKEIGQEDFDLEHNLRDPSGQLGDGEEEDGNSKWPLVYEHLEKAKNGGFFYINTDRCHIQIMSDEIYSMSDGTLKRYMGGKSSAGADIAFNDDKDPVAEGKLSHMKDRSYELISGQKKVSEAADIVKAYFEKGTPYPPIEEMHIDIPFVQIYPLKDKYVYRFQLRRKYENIPFAYRDFGEQSMIPVLMGQEISEDIKNAYIADNHVCAFTGMTEMRNIEKLMTETKILDLKDAVEYLKQKLAPELRIQMLDVEFEYCPTIMSEEGERIIFPVWMFEGKELTGDRRVRIYIDALTGEVSYYTYSWIEIGEGD